MPFYLKPCYNCGQMGHLAKNCPSPRRSTGNRAPAHSSARAGPSPPSCYNCGQAGHKSRSCPLHQAAAHDKADHCAGDRNRKYFDKLTKSSDASIPTREHALRLFESAIEFATIEGTEALVYRLVTHIGLSALEKAMKYLDADMLRAGVLPLLLLLSKKELRAPALMRPVDGVAVGLFNMHDQFLPRTLRQHLPTTANDAAAVGWLYVVVAKKFPNRRSEMLEMGEALARICKYPDLLKFVGNNFEEPTEDPRAPGEMPGGRHDNDCLDFHNIKIAPTVDQIRCHADPFLPTSDNQSFRNEAELLDKLFRLYHEDVVGPMRKLLSSPAEIKRLSFKGRMEKIGSRPPPPPPQPASANGHPQAQLDRRGPPAAPCFMFSLAMPEWHRYTKLKTAAQRLDFWEKSKRLLPKGSLACIVRQMQPNGGYVPIRVGTISRRDPNELAVVRPSIGITFFSDMDSTEAIADLAEGQEGQGKIRLLVASSSFFAYEPVLRCLQSIESIPFPEELVYCQPSTPPLDLLVAYKSTLKRPPPLLAKALQSLNPSQINAVADALSSRVALIQGPPGTGKTHVGVILANIILQSSSATILLVCYTNHALDSFLEDIIKAGVQSIVRIGGSCKSAAIAPYRLQELGKTKSVWSAAQKSRNFELRAEMEQYERSVTILKKRCSRTIGKEWWSTVSEHLEDNAYSSYLQLHVTPEELVDDDGFEVQGISGEDYLWKCWLSGKQPPAHFASRNLKKQPLWMMTKQQRVQQKLQWQRAIFEDDRVKLALHMRLLADCLDEIQKLQDLKFASVLASNRVIACTTTGAAKYTHLLAQAAPEVLLIEEAAEIMEAHVITSLNPQCKHLIMIGDHKQLRPKAEHFMLTVEARRGYDLNQSLFERLMPSLGAATLTRQHRMHPDIAVIPREITYNELQDAPKVALYAPIQGLHISNRVIFIDHREPEDRHPKNAEDFDSVSKTNKHEVDMVASIVKYLLQQGRSRGEIVVLTPYLGQLLKIKEKLVDSIKGNVFVSSADMAEATKALSGHTEFQLGGARDQDDSVRVATVDNFQGEEANIIIVSLVRSNPENNIGFLREPERVNVMLSRAKHCEIILGNSETLQAAKQAQALLSGGPLWRRIIELLRASGSLYRGLPTKCVNHGTTHELATSNDFIVKCPDGGCCINCLHMLKCGHMCKKPCHVATPESHTKPCKENVYGRCAMGHISLLPCFQTLSFPSLGELDFREMTACSSCSDILRATKAAELADKNLKLVRSEQATKLEKLQKDERARFLRRRAELEQSSQVEELETKLAVLRSDSDRTLKTIQEASEMKTAKLEQELREQKRSHELKHHALEKEMKEHAVRVEREHEQEVALVRQQAEAKEFLLMDRAGAAYEASARHHQHRLTAARDVRLFPPTWSGQLQFELVDVTNQLLQPAGETYLACMQALVDGTAGTYGHGRDQVVVGKYSKLKVVKVQRIENRILFMAYHARRSGLLAEEGNRIVVKDCKSFRPWQRDLLDHRINEVYLFHATRDPSSIPKICKSGLNERLCGGMYGHGVYFADQSTKSDQYSGVNHAGLFSMFVCRVALGKHVLRRSVSSGTRILPEVPGLDGVRYASAIAGKAHTEYIVYDGSGTYPEYLLEYQRR